MSKIFFKSVASDDEIVSVVHMAHVIWNEHYPAVIGQAQVDYMVEKFQSYEAIAEQIKNGFQFFIASTGDESIGYISFELKEDCLFLSKVYLFAGYRGRGYGRELLEFVFDQALQNNKSFVRLTVNKFNNNSIMAYEKVGFIKVDEVVMDIGGGYVMDDYVFEKVLN